MANHTAFNKWASISSYLTAAAGFLYTITFYWLNHSNSHAAALLNNKFLLLAGLFGIAVFLQLFIDLRETNLGLAAWALTLGILGLAGSLIHGGYGLATTISAPAGAAAAVNPVDPRGLLTFGLTGLALVAFGYLMAKNSRYGTNLAYLAKLVGVLLLAIYILRLWSPDSATTLYKDIGAVVGLVLAPILYIKLSQVFAKK